MWSLSVEEVHGWVHREDDGFTGNLQRTPQQDELEITEYEWNGGKD